MQQLGTLRLETPRLILRRFEAKDAPAAFANWESDEAVTCFLRWQACTSLAQTEQILRGWIDGYVRSDFYLWAIVPKDGSDAPIGTISVVEMDRQIKAAELGYCIGKEFWNRGYTTEAMQAVLAFLFDCVGMNRISAQHDPRNPASGAVMRKCGLRYEGTLRQADFNNQGIVDAAVYGILASEYHTERRIK